MDLWTEFEGATIDSAYCLKQLLQTEGRSAFFSTLNAKGDPVLIRIIECHFDEDEILARWRGVEMLGHPAFLRIERFGQFLIEDDEITAVYAVFEHVDENLAHVLERGRLSAAEATQIGRSVASALETLHAHGFVHQHVEARNIYAVGETVKMRSDCIRETPEGEVGLEARRRDVRDLAVLLMQVLRGVGGAAPGRSALPAPFNEIVQNGMAGDWGLTEIQRALTPPESEKNRPAKSGAGKANGTPALPAQNDASASGGASAAIDNVRARAARLVQGSQMEPEIPEPLDPQAKKVPAPTEEPPLPGRRRASMEVPVIFGISQEEMRRWLTAGGLLLAVTLLGAFLIHHWTAGNAPAAPPETAATLRPPAALAAAHPAPAAESAPAAPPRWRVVAFTYNRKDQAQKKALMLAHKYPGVQASVLSPTGRAPWLVTIGGALDRGAAYTLARKARSMGLPRDTYAQNYKGR